MTPAASASDGTCESTTTPITAAVAGSSETSSAYVARLPRHRELVEHVRDHRRGDADADAGQQGDRVGQGRQRRPSGQRRHDDEGDQHRQPERLDAHEQQHGERGAEVVEDRAADEVGVWRDALLHVRAASRAVCDDHMVNRRSWFRNGFESTAE